MEWHHRREFRAEFESFVRAASPILLRTCFLIVKDPVESEDLVQESLLRAARTWPRVRAMEYPVAYVRRILVNLALRASHVEATARARRGGGEPEDPDELADERGQGALVMIDTRSEILWALNSLPRNQRAVVVLRYFEDLSEREIADELGWPVGTVKSTAARAMDRLRAAYDAHGEHAARGESARPTDLPSSDSTKEAHHDR